MIFVLISLISLVIVFSIVYKDFKTFFIENNESKEKFKIFNLLSIITIIVLDFLLYKIMNFHSYSYLVYTIFSLINSLYGFILVFDLFFNIVLKKHLYYIYGLVITGFILLLAFFYNTSLFSYILILLTKSILVLLSILAFIYLLAYIVAYRKYKKEKEFKEIIDKEKNKHLALLDNALGFGDLLLYPTFIIWTIFIPDFIKNAKDSSIYLLLYKYFFYIFAIANIIALFIIGVKYFYYKLVNKKEEIIGSALYPGLIIGLYIITITFIY